jgi:hypothetical protein
LRKELPEKKCMKKLLKIVACLGLFCVFATIAFAQRSAVTTEIIPPKGYKPPVIRDSPELELILDASIKAMLAKHSSVAFKPGELSATLLDLRDPQNIGRAQYNGELKLYPASVVKMYYMAALERQR